MAVSSEQAAKTESNVDGRTRSKNAVELREKISVAKQSGGYMYPSDPSVPPEVTFERYRWIMDRVKRYGA
jgi:hypothetical protein